MPKVKDRYLKPVLKLYDINKKWICNLTTNNPKNSIFNLKKNMKVNEVDTLSFQIAFDNTHISPNSCEMLIKHEFDWYIIKSVTLNSGDTRYLNVECESEFTISKTVLCEPIEIIGETPKKMFSDIMEAIPDNKLNYVFKETDVTNKRSLIVESETSLFENLIKMAEAFECTVRFSYGSDGIKYVSFIKEPHDRGRVIRRNNNLKNLNIIYDTSELFTKIMPFGADDDGIEINIGDVNPTKKLYVENYDYFVAKGMTEEQIKNNMQAQALKVIKYADIVDENDLYNLALRDLKKYSKPRVKGTVEYADLSVLEGSISIEPLIHERIKIADSEIKMTLSSEISEIEIDYENILNSKITLDNVIEYNSIFKDLIAQGEKIDSVIGTNPNTGKPSLIAGAIQGKIDAAIAGIVGQVDVAEKMVPYAILFECNIEGHDLYGAVALGTKGLLIAKEKNTDNSWKWKTAINANGVYADELVGLTIMGEQIIAGTISSLDKSTWINLEDGTFNFADKIKFVDGKFTIALSSGQTLDEWKDEYEQNKNDIDKDIADIQDQLEGVIGDIGGALTDGIIDELEMNIIKDRLVQFNKEKDDITMRYNNLYKNPSLSGEAKSNLKAKYDLFITKHNSLVKTINEIIEDRKATEAERKAFTAAVKEYNAVIPQLSKAFDDALNCISKNTSQSLIEQTADSIKLEVKNVKEGLESSIKQTADAIYTKVSSVENKITASNGDVSDLVDRIESAEQKITATAITSTISSAINNGSGKIETTQFVMDKKGFTINNGGLTIKNKAGTTVLNSDTKGNLVLSGTVKSQNGDQYVAMNSGGIDFKDHHLNEQLMRVGCGYFADNRDQNGVNFALAQCGDYVRFSHIEKEDLTNGWSNTDKQYIFMDMWHYDITIGNSKYKKGVTMYAPLHINDGIRLNYKGSENTQNVVTSSAWNGVTGLLGLYGDNGTCIGYQEGSNLMSRIVVTESAMPGTDDRIKSWGNWNCSGYTVHDATFAGKFVNTYANTLTKTFTETHCIEAENKQIRVNFSNVQLKNGKAILNIPKRYININTGYTVASIVKKGKGDVWIAEELENKFIIEGTEDIKINIEVIIHLEDESLYASTAKTTDEQQLCINMSTGQPIGV